MSDTPVAPPQTSIGTSSRSAANWGMVGHEWAVDMLRAHIREGRPRHAYLITGPRGVGRRTLAWRLVQALSCTQASAPGEACNECPACKLALARRHPDVIEIQALTDVKGTGIPMEGGILKVEQIRELRRIMHLHPTSSQYRFGMLLRFHEANESAANALLKTLEEPSPHALLILTADDAEQLLPTIISRCDVLRLRLLPVDVVAADLRARGLDAPRAQMLAHLSGGRPGYARRLAEEPHLLEIREARLNDLQMLLPATRAAKFAYADGLSKEKEGLRATFLLWLSFWRDVLLRASHADTPIVNLDRAAEIDALAVRLGLGGARRMVQRHERALDQLERNVNARLLTEVLLLDCPVP